MSYHLCSKSSPSTLLLFHFPTSLLFSWPPELCCFATITVFLPCSPLLVEASRRWRILGTPKAQFEDVLLHPKVSPTFRFGHTRAPPWTLSLPPNTTPIRGRLPNLCSFPFTHFSTSYSDRSCPSSSAQAVPWLSHPILAILASRASLSRWDLKAIQCQWCSHINTLRFLFLWLSQSQHANPWAQLPDSFPFILLEEFTWICWLAPWGKLKSQPKF